ncbi:MAG: hypothetical protein ACE5I1_00635 [bacterium]
MNLLKTTTLSPDADPASNEQAFNNALAETKVLLIVLGQGAATESLVQMADNIAGEPTDPRWVVWAQRPGDIAAAVAGLECSADPSPVLDSDRGFSISLTNAIRDVIRASELEPDPVRVFEAYRKAEEDE